MKLQIRQVVFLMLMPSWFFPSCIERTGIITALTTLCPSPCFPESHPQPFQPTLLPPPHPPLPQPQLPCPSPCLPPLPPAPPLPQPQLPCPLPSLPPAPPLPQLPCPSSCPPTPLPRLPCTSPMSTYQQPFTPQQPLPPSQPSFPSNQLYFQQNPYQPYQPSSQIPYAPNQQLPPPSYSTKPISIPQLIQQPASYSTPSGLSYGYGYGRQSSTYNTNPYYQNNPIPAKEKFIVEEKQEQQHERIKDPFEKIDDNDVENKSGDDDRTKTKNMRQRINPQLRDEAFYARPTTDISLPKPMPPIIYPTPIPMYQQQPPPLQTSVMAPAPIYQSSSFIQPYQQIQCPPCPIPTPQQIPIPSQPTPMQNCCLRCGAPCKSMALLKSYGVKTNPYLHGGVSSIDELSFHTKKMDEDKCNDNELAVILREALTLKMNLAKERIMERVEQRLLASTNVRTPNTHFHIVCAPRMLEYIIHAEKFCSGDVADGVCFVFKTG